MSRDPSLNGMIYFESVARNGRVTRAAEELCVSPSAVSQQLKQLEELLGIKLFRREKRQLSLTLEGEQLYLATAAAFGALNNARQSISKRRESRQLILKASPSFAVRWFGPKLHTFISKYPEWDLRIDASPDPSNFDREFVDIDIRYGHGDWTGLDTRLILADYVLPMCSPAYKEQIIKHDSSNHSIFQNARLIDSVKTIVQWDTWLARHRIERCSTNSDLRFDRSAMAIQQAINGVGVILDSTTLTIEELKSGALVPLVPHLGAMQFPAYWGVAPARHMARKLVCIFLDWVNSEASAHEKTVRDYLTKESILIKDEPDIFSHLDSATR